jgi:predicted phage-related endonuclease
MMRGTALEAVIADRYAAETGRTLRKVNEILSHPEYPFMLANIDRHIVSENGRGPGVLEIKAPGLQVFSKCKREGLPDYYLIQLQHYLAVKGWKWGSYGIMNAERWEMLWFDIDRDDELIDYIITHDKKFWNENVLAGVPPEIADAPDLNLPKIGADSFVRMEDLPEWKKAVEDLRAAKDIMEEAKALDEQAKGQIIKIMTAFGAEIVEGAGARVYYKEQAGRKTFDKKRLAKDHPQIDLAAYENTGKPFFSLRPYFLKNTVME